MSSANRAFSFFKLSIGRQVGKTGRGEKEMLSSGAFRQAQQRSGGQVIGYIWLAGGNGSGGRISGLHVRVLVYAYRRVHLRFCQLLCVCVSVSV